MKRFALWPDPVGHDICFAKAGFRGFADLDDQWDADFESMMDRLFETLLCQGLPQIASGELPVRRVGLLRRKEEGSIRDGLLCAATDDQFFPFQVQFGEPAQARMTTADGHPIFWIELAEPSTFETLLKTVADELSCTETGLSWEFLLPSVFA